MKPSELLATPDKWTQGAFAKDAGGKPCPLNSDAERCWCVMGALIKYFGEYSPEFYSCVNEISSKLDAPITEWNDSPKTTHAEVLAKLRECGL